MVVSTSSQKYIYVLYSLCKVYEIKFCFKTCIEIGWQDLIKFLEILRQ